MTSKHNCSFEDDGRSKVMDTLRLVITGFLLVVTLTCGVGCPRSQPPAQLHHLRNLGKVHFERGSQEGYKKAAELYAKALEASGGDADDRLNLVRALLFSGKEESFTRALAEVEKLLESRSEAEIPTTLHYLEGLAAKRCGEVARAVTSFERVTRKDPSCTAAWYQLGSLELGRKNYDESLRAFARAADRDQSFIGVGSLYKMSQAYRLSGKVAEADDFLLRFKALQATLPEGNPGADIYESTRYTRASLIPALRRVAEPPLVRLAFEEKGRWQLAGRLAPDLTVFDFDGDGDEDWIGFGAAGAQVFRNDGSSLFTEVTELAGFSEVDTARDATAGDFDNDGLIDVFFFGRESSGLLFKNMGEGSFEAQPRSGARSTAGALDAHWRDFDHDGDLDLVLLLAGGGVGEAMRARVLRNNGDATFLSLDGESSAATDVEMLRHNE